MGAHDARRQDAIARIGEHEVEVESVGKRELLLTQHIGVLVTVPLKGHTATCVGETVIYDRENLPHACYQGTLLESLREPAFSSSVWRTRVTELVSDLRLSSR